MNAEDVARWMQAEFEKTGFLYQDTVVRKIKNKFGDEFVYKNANGNLAISKAVLKEFRRLTETTAVWDRGVRQWRRRRPSDPKSRQVE
jgi:hypothetical protein